MRPARKDRQAGLVLVIGIVVTGALALAGYRFGQDEVMAVGIVGMILLAIWAFARPDARGGDAGGDPGGSWQRGDHGGFGGDGGADGGGE